ALASAPAPRASPRLLLGLLLRPRISRLGLGLRLRLGNGCLGGRRLRRRGLLLAPAPSPRATTGLLLRLFGLADGLVAVLRRQNGMCGRLSDVLDANGNLLPDALGSAFDGDDVTVEARDRVVHVMEMGLLELDLELLAALDGSSLRLDF